MIQVIEPIEKDKLLTTNVTRIFCHTLRYKQKGCCDCRSTRGSGGQRELTVKNTCFATALVNVHSVGVTIRADNIGKAFEAGETYLQERNPGSEVTVQAVQRISNAFADSGHTPSHRVQA
jgi:hypothetical protein